MSIPLQMGFVATEAAEKLGFEYDSDSELARFIYPILNDMEKESPDHVYDLHGIWGGSNQDLSGSVSRKC